MQKRHLAKLCSFILACLILVGCLSGCAAKKDPVTWLVPTSAEQLKSYQALFARFTEETGIESEVIGSEYSQIYPKLQTMIASKAVPEVHAYGTEFVPWAARGAMTPMDSYIEENNFDMSRFNQNMVESLQWKGEQYEIPLGMGTCVLFYNKALFEEAGVEEPTHDWGDGSWTMEAFLETAQKLTLDSRGRNALDPNFDEENIVQFGIGGMQTYWFYPWYFGGDWTDPEVTKFTGNEPEAIEAMQFIADLSNKYHVMPTAEQSQAMSAGGNLFLTGRVAMSVEGSWDCVTFEQADFEWDIACTPMGKQHSIVLFTDGIGIGANCNNLEGGWELMEWIFNDHENYMEMLDAMYAMMTIPAMTDATDEVKDILAQRYPGVDINVMFDAAEQEDACPVYMRYHENFTQMDEILRQEAIDPISTGEISAEEALNAVADDIQKLIDDIQ